MPRCSMQARRRSGSFPQGLRWTSSGSIGWGRSFRAHLRRRRLAASYGSIERVRDRGARSALQHPGVVSGSIAAASLDKLLDTDPAFRQRLLCGLTILGGLQPAGVDHWNSGSLYNPDDGETYRVSAELRSADVFVARMYLAWRSLVRPRPWCGSRGSGRKDGASAT
jgi:hypothetical protein